MIDPSTSDITGRGLETLAALDFVPEHSAVRRARLFYSRSRSRRTWFGRWGCNYIYGSWLVLRGLQCSGEDMTKDRLQATARWLQSVQNSDGGWGELPQLRRPQLQRKGPSTPSQTAWAILGLIASGNPRSQAFKRACLSDPDSTRGWVLAGVFDGDWVSQGVLLALSSIRNLFPLLALGHFIQSSRQGPKPPHEGSL
jgi:squalene-hopene/tetraprenyl-beta-curcumene cyclase